MVYKRFLPKRFDAAETIQMLGSGKNATLKSEFTVLVWNIYKARKKSWNQDFASLCEGKDLVLLQEAVLGTTFDHLFKVQERMEWIMAQSHFNPRTLCGTGVKTGSSASSIAKFSFSSPDFEPIFNTHKMLLATEYMIESSEDPLLVLNVHAINFVSLPKYLKQIEQIETAIKKSRGPVLLAGDFNTWSNERYAALTQSIAKLGLTELSLVRKARASHLYRHLDHVFYRGLQPIGLTLQRVKSSDHDPICVTFRVAQ